MSVCKGKLKLFIRTHLGHHRCNERLKKLIVIVGQHAHVTRLHCVHRVNDRIPVMKLPLMSCLIIVNREFDECHELDVCLKLCALSGTRRLNSFKAKLFARLPSFDQVLPFSDIRSIYFSFTVLQSITSRHSIIIPPLIYALIHAIHILFVLLDYNATLMTAMSLFLIFSNSTRVLSAFHCLARNESE